MVKCRLQSACTLAVRAGLVSFATLALATGVARAADLESQNTHKTLPERFAEMGIYPTANYTGEAASNVSGGQRKHHWGYADQEAGGIHLEMSKLVGIDEAWFSVIFTNRNGHNVAARGINNSVSVQQIYGDGQTYRLTQMTWFQGFDNNRFNLYVGRQAAKASFLTSKFYCDFQSNVICGNPAIITKDTNPTSWPMPSWGARVEYNYNDNWRVRTGVFEAYKKDYQEHSKHGFNMGTKYDNGVWVPFEVKYHTDIKDDPYPVMLALGGAYDSGKFTTTRTTPPQTHRGRVLLWGQAEKMVWKPDVDSKRGITLFSMLSVATSSKQTDTLQATGGLVWKGPFEERPDDKINLMGTLLRKSKDNRSGVTKRHPDLMMFEANYGIQVVPALLVRPSLQYVVHPDGGGGRFSAPKNNHIKDAFVVGGHVEFDLNTFSGFQKPKIPE